MGKNQRLLLGSIDKMRPAFGKATFVWKDIKTEILTWFPHNNEEFRDFTVFGMLMLSIHVYAWD